MFPVRTVFVCRYLVHYGVSFDKYFGAYSIKLSNGTRTEGNKGRTYPVQSYSCICLCVVRVHDLCLAEIMIHINGRVLVSCDIYLVALCSFRCVLALPKRGGHKFGRFSFVCCRQRSGISLSLMFVSEQLFCT